MTAPRNIPFGKPWITDSEKQAVMDVLNSPILTHGPQGHAFEEEFAQFVGEEAYCVSTSSCMAALHLSYLVYDIKAGDEVIVPAQTHVATAHAVEMVGATPIFVDCDNISGNIDVEQMAKKITPRTKAISLVHFLGVPCNMQAILELAQKHDLIVIEDCAIALGARYKDKHVGLWGDTGCFSFYPVKHITTGDGGMFITRHTDIAERVAKIRGFGVDRTFTERKIPGMYDVNMLGLNYRMSDINAAIGRKQLERMPEILSKRKTNFEQLKNGLKDIPNTSILDNNLTEAIHSHYCLSIILEGGLEKLRYEIIQGLKAAGIGTSVYYPQPVPRMAYYQEKYGYNPADYPQAARISDQSIALSVGPHVSSEDVDYMINAFNNIMVKL